MSHAPWSISKAQVALDCKFRFHLKYVKKNKGKAVESSAGRVGTAVHAILEYMVKGMDYPTAFKKAVMMNNMTNKEMSEVKGFESGVFRFMEKFAGLKGKLKIKGVLTEKQVAITRDYQPCDYWDKNAWLRGVIDLGVLVEKNGLTYMMVIDHKSGAPKPMDTYEAQLNSYLVMGLANFDDLSGIQSAIHWLAAEEVLNQPVVEWSTMRQSEQITNQVTPLVTQYINAAEAAANAQPVPTVGWFCAFCEYQDICPKKK